MAKYYTLKVVGLRKETKDAVTIIFKQPALKKIRYTAGQYLTLIFRINGRRYSRPYSLSSAPQVDQALEITVKRVQGGVVSNHIIDNLNIDDIVEVMEPMGNFILNESALSFNTHIVLWGAGSGITPLMSLLKYALHKNNTQNVTLIYGNRDADSIIFFNNLTELHKRYENFSVYHFHTQNAVVVNESNIIKGRIDKHQSRAIMQSMPDLHNTVHYICGPVGLKQSVIACLQELGIEKKKIFSEDFEIVRNPEEFEGIITRTVSVKIAADEYAVEVGKGKSILEAGLDTLLDLPYSCQTGSCLVCKAKLISGKVKTIGVEIPEGLTDSECLLCCSFPLTDNIEVEI